MTTKQTLRDAATPPKAIKGNPTCGNGHEWTPASTRWRFRDRSHRKGHGYTGWERDCLICKEVAKGRKGSGLRSQSWLPGGTNG